MDSITVLLTAAGCPGGVPLIRALQREGVRVVAADARPSVPALQFADAFYTLPLAKANNYIDVVEEIVEEELVNLVLPQNNAEALALARGKGRIPAVVLTGSSRATEICLDKWDTYAAVQNLVPIPECILCRTANQTIAALQAFNAQFDVVVLKQPTGAGSRGYHLVVPEFDRLSDGWRDWPRAATVTFHEVREALERNKVGLPVMVMEYLPGDAEPAVDVYCAGGEVLAGFVHDRHRCEFGLCKRHVVVERPDEWRWTVAIARELKWDGFLNVQFKAGKLLEVNPRISTMIYSRDYNLPLLGIRHALGLATETELRAALLAPGAWMEYYTDAVWG